MYERMSTLSFSFSVNSFTEALGIVSVVSLGSSKSESSLDVARVSEELVSLSLDEESVSEVTDSSSLKSCVTLCSDLSESWLLLPEGLVSSLCPLRTISPVSSSAVDLVGSDQNPSPSGTSDS